MRTKRDLALGEWAVLALLDEAPSHGWALVRALTPEGEVGKVWSFPRPLVYRALTGLTGAGLAEPQRVEASASGPERTVLRVTAEGRRRVAGWLDEPVIHVRELRSALMLKLLFRSRRGLPLDPLLASQRDRLAPIADAVADQAARSEGFDRLLLTWRLESVTAALRFLEAAADGAMLYHSSI